MLRSSPGHVCEVVPQERNITNMDTEYSFGCHESPETVHNPRINLRQYCNAYMSCSWKCAATWRFH
eukprot:4147278-Amphidinium_carterae.1